MEKTTLLTVGPIGPTPAEIIELGFKVGPEFTLLGMAINRDLNDVYDHLDDVSTKIARCIEYWERFYLSLPGRIAVCKTFMLSQIGYLGCFITPTGRQIKELQNRIDKFCLGTLSVAKNRLYSSPVEGGLGIINLENYITSLQCVWVKRVMQHWGDTWRYDVKLECFGNPLIADVSTWNVNSNPVLHNIGSSFGKFKKAFYSKDQNYLKAFIFRNPLITRNRNDKALLCEKFFGFENERTIIPKIAKLKYDDFFVRRRPKSLHEINQEFGINLSLNTYLRLFEALNLFKNRWAGKSGPAQSLDTFLNGFEKGSKPFRRIIEYEAHSRLNISTLNTVKTFFELIGLPIENSSILRSCWGEWNGAHYKNRCREFLYKFRNNVLGLNVRVSKFANNIGAECSLCIEGKEPLPRRAETFLHLFFECQHSEKYRACIISKLFPELQQANQSGLKKFWFLGILPNEQKYNIFISGIVNTVNFAIWNYKLRKELPPVSIFYQDFQHAIVKLLVASNEMRIAKTNGNYWVCRYHFTPP